jgi:hypothetical protein
MTKRLKPQPKADVQQVMIRTHILCLIKPKEGPHAEIIAPPNLNIVTIDLL